MEGEGDEIKSKQASKRDGTLKFIYVYKNILFEGILKLLCQWFDLKLMILGKYMHMLFLRRFMKLSRFCNFCTNNNSMLHLH